MPGGGGQTTRLPSLGPNASAVRPEAGGGNDDEDDSLLVDAELLKYWEAAAGENGVEMPMSMTQSKKKKGGQEEASSMMNMTFDAFKGDMKERKTGTGALSRPLHGINSVDKSFYGLLHTSQVGALISEDTRANWALLTRSLASAGGDSRSVSTPPLHLITAVITTGPLAPHPCTSSLL
jgi:hypothetical protein